MKRLNIDIKSKSFWISLAVRIVLLACGIKMIMLYYAPLRVHILNAGNAFGLGVGALLIISALLLNSICIIAKRMWNSKKIKPFFVTALALVIVVSSVFVGTLASIVKSSEYSATNQTTVIVLGCRIWGSNPSSALKLRARAATDYLNSNPDAVAILSGGQGSDENLSEAQCIFNLMTADGISPDRLFIEDKSTNTDENIANSKRIIEANGLSKDVAIATTDYHQKRASMICKKNGLNPASLPSKSGKDTKATFFTREVFGIWAQWLGL